MKKQDVGDMFVKAASLLRTVTKERDTLKTKLASVELNSRIDKLASEMKRRGINTQLSEEEMRKDLVKKAQEGRLDVIEEAVSLSSGVPSNFSGFTSPGGSDITKQSEASAASLSSFILTGEG